MNEYLVDENKDYILITDLSILPKMDSSNEFAILCEQILFGNGLDKILEEGEEDEDKTNRKREKKKEVNNTDELVRLIDNSSFVVTSSPIKKSNQVLGISGKNINGILS